MARHQLKPEIKSRFVLTLPLRLEIAFLRQEESHTSKASFVHMDDIPVYGVDDEKLHFSGSRVKRDLYKIAKGEYVNADLNASANILCKAFPAAFAESFVKRDFQNVRVIKHPDYEKTAAMRKSQPKKKKRMQQIKVAQTRRQTSGINVILLG